MTLYTMKSAVWASDRLDISCAWGGRNTGIYGAAYMARNTVYAAAGGIRAVYAAQHSIQHNITSAVWD